MTIRPFIAALCGVLLLTACTPTAPEAVGEPASEGSQISSEPLEVVCDDPDAPPELTAKAEDKALPMLMRPEYWNGSVTCGPDLATMLIETRAGEVPALHLPAVCREEYQFFRGAVGIICSFLFSGYGIDSRFGPAGAVQSAVPGIGRLLQE